MAPLCFTARARLLTRHAQRSTRISKTADLPVTPGRACFKGEGHSHVTETRSARRHSIAICASASVETAKTPAVAQVENPVCLVTGASRGIGRAIALALGASGAQVAVNYAASSDAAEAVVEEIRASGGAAMAIQGNVADPAQVDALVSGVLQEFGRIDVLVNNAGITRDNLMMRMKPQQWQEVIDTNLSSVFYITKAVMKGMLKQRRGRIVNISSVVGLTGNPGQTNYSAAKAGLIGLTKSTARELAPRGITANAVAPGFIMSDMTASLSEALETKILEQIPMGHPCSSVTLWSKCGTVGRFGNPEEVAGLVKFLALDPAAGYITGQVYNVDGGLVML